MSAIGEVGPSSFDSYEGIRIAIPGIIAVSSGQATLTTVAPSFHGSIASQTLTSLVASLLAGLVLYYWDIPARSAAYTERQPTDTLEKEYPDVSSAALVTVYLNLLNTKMPTTMRNRALYIGSMYRIGLEMILSLALASSICIAVSVLDYGAATPDDHYIKRLSCAGFIVLTFALGVTINIGYERKSASRLRIDAEKTIRSSAVELWRRSSLLYLAGIVLITGPNLKVVSSYTDAGHRRALCIAGMGICMTYWLIRYVQGDRRADCRKRRRLGSVSSGLLYATPIALALAIYPARQHSVLNTSGRLYLWTAIACVTLLLIMVRGHERKLHGSYSGQTRWLKDNITEVDLLIRGEQESISKHISTPKKDSFIRRLFM